MKKKFILLALALILFAILVVGLVACDDPVDPNNPNNNNNNHDNTEDQITINGITYEFSDEYPGLCFVLDTECNEYGVVANTINMDLRKTTKSQFEVTIPSEFKGKPVTVIRELAFSQTPFSRVIIPDTIREIGDHAFSYGCGITSAVIPDSVKYVGRGAFDNLNLKELTLGNGLEGIGEKAFLAQNITTLSCDISAFSWFADSFETGGYSFAPLETLNITGGTEIPTGVFGVLYGCVGGGSPLKNFTVADSVTTVGDKIWGQYYHYIENATVPAVACKSVNNSYLKSLTLTNGELTPDMIAKSKNLENLTITSNVMSIDANAFLEFSKLKTITVNGNDGKYIAVDNCLIDKNNKELILGTSISIIPTDGTITVFGEYAFSSRGINLDSDMLLKIGTDNFYIKGHAFEDAVFENQTIILPDKDSLAFDFYAFWGTNIRRVFSLKTSYRDLVSTTYLPPNSTLYLYSESEPPLNSLGTDYDDKYWHYDLHEKPVVWVKQ